MKIIFSLLLIIGIHTQVSSQRISIKQRNETLGNGNNPAIVATIFEADASDIEKEWKSLMKSYDAKVTMGGEIFADNAKFKGFDNTCDVYARIKNINDKEKELMIAIDLGGIYLSDNHPQFKKIENLVYEFAVKITKDAIQAQLKDAEKNQKRLQKEQERLSEDKVQLEKDIENYKNKITSAKKEIEENLKAQEAKKQEIELQKKLLTEISDKFEKVK